MKDKELYQLHAEICQTLTHPIRLAIIDELREGERTVTELVDTLEAPQATVSRHLGVMRSRGIVVGRRDGTCIFYRLGSQRIAAAYDQMHQYAIEYLAAQSEMLTVSS